MKLTLRSNAFIGNLAAVRDKNKYNGTVGKYHYSKQSVMSRFVLKGMSPLPATIRRTTGCLRQRKN